MSKSLPPLFFPHYCSFNDILKSVGIPMYFISILIASTPFHIGNNFVLPFLNFNLKYQTSIEDLMEIFFSPTAVHP